MLRKSWVLLFILVLLLTGCGKPVEPPPPSSLPSDEIFQIALPRIVIDVDSEGNPGVMGLSPAVLKALGVDVSGMQVPAATVKQMTDANLQHIEIASVGDRLVIMANGKPLPHLGWDQASLQRALDLADVLKVQNAALYKKLLPLVTRLGLNLVLRFPPQPGAAEIPLAEPGAARKIALTPTAEPASLIAKFEVKFDEKGVPGIMGLSGTDLAALGLGAIGGLSPDMIANLQSGNLQNMELRMKPDGLHIYVNGEPLPVVIWDSKLLADAVEVYGQLSPNSPMLPVIQLFLPYLDRADVGILLHFPPAAGKDLIPAKMHE
jgi:hypothetical protein